MGKPQNQKSGVAGSPTGHLHVRSVSSRRLIFLAFFSISETFAKASGLISFADGCGGSGWPAGIICRLARLGLGFVSCSFATGSAFRRAVVSDFVSGLA